MDNQPEAAERAGDQSRHRLQEVWLRRGGRARRPKATMPHCSQHVNSVDSKFCTCAGWPGGISAETVGRERRIRSATEVLSDLRLHQNGWAQRMREGALGV